MPKMKYDDMKNISEANAKANALETMKIKEHNIYFVEFDGAFGYSALVYCNGKHIYYADDYELHHAYMIKEKGREGLRQWYIDTMNQKLYTEEEIVEPLKNYDDYQAKQYFLRNYYNMRVDYISAFYIGEKEGNEIKKKTKNMHYDPVAFCYVNDLDFVKHHIELLVALQKREAEMKETPEYWIQAFKHEMYNHEYSINWDADCDTLSAFGNIPRELTWNRAWKLSDLFDVLNFNDVQKNAYHQAKREYYAEIERSEDIEECTS